MEFLEIPLYDDDVFKLGVRFLLNIIFLFLMLRFAIQPNQREREFAFSAVMMNVTVFFICFTLKKLELGLGMALGLFAIFGILRYRADAISTKEMTYLFIVIALAVINSLSNHKTSYVELLFVNAVILGGALLKEAFLGREAEKIRVAEKVRDAEGKEKTNGSRKVAKGNDKQKKYMVRYDRLEWLGAEHETELLSDIALRTGLLVNRCKIVDIDLVSGAAMLQVWQEDRKSEEADGREE